MFNLFRISAFAWDTNEVKNNLLGFTLTEVGEILLISYVSVCRLVQMNSVARQCFHSFP